MKVLGNAIRPGMVLNHKGRLVVVTKIELRTPGNLRAFNQVVMQDVENGTKYNERFSSVEAVERVRLEQRKYQYLYDEGDFVVFMDNETYEQINLSKDLVGEQAHFLEPEMQVTIESHEGRPLGITLPEQVTATIAETEPALKGQTASSSYKPAILENGVRIMVPPFIEAGTRIVINVSACEYVERARD